MAETLTVEIDADLGNTSATINEATTGLDDLNRAADTAGSGLDGAGDAAQGTENRLAGLGAGALAGAAGFASMTDIVGQAVDMWNLGDQAADDLARAEADVEQATLDLAQANVDGRQAQLDANQAKIDGKQAGIDLKQALLDQETAQKDYNDAVKEFGKDSAEAKQAAIDMEQADADAEQAKLDAKQATEDLSQAQLDGKQATIDGKNAQLDLNEAQRNVQSAEIMGGWFGVVSQLGTVILGLVGTFALLAGGMLTTAATAVSSAATTAASWIASMVSQAATAVVTAATTAGAWIAAWVSMAVQSLIQAARMAVAWLIAMGPIALVIAAVIGLVVVIVKNWDTITKAVSDGWTWLVDHVLNPIGRFFTQTIPGWVEKGVGWIEDKWDGLISWLSNLPGRVGRAVSGLFDGIPKAFRSALNSVIGAWNGLSFTVGGGSFMGVDVPSFTLSTPNIPYLAEGGIVTRPTLAMIGEGGEDEAVLPLSKMNRLLGRTGSSTRVEIALSGPEEVRRLISYIVATEGEGDVQKAFT
ncbi:hypothetical protein [Streptomyces sp. G1]|uniref:hypothetical protein n=1 Tax=Streptomyces sp. G1 TaxID=361572 RepID=UPI00202EA716|nr:hypothetical protein [Streptomyces sp. G1]MCM1974010.1 hypothetical protein [Streptomyces sp. G1]